MNLLEQRLGLAPASPVAEEQVQTISIGGPSNGQTQDPGQQAALQSEAEKQLEELEKRMQS